MVNTSVKNKKTNPLLSLKNDKNFVRKVVAVSLPIMLQQLLNNVLNLIDTLMIGTLGESTIAAVGLANKVFFVYGLLIFGVSSGASILQAQYWGAADQKRVQKVQGITLVLSVAAGIVFTVAATAFPLQVMRIFTNSSAAAKIGAEYLQYVAISYIPTAITMVYISTLRSMNKVNAPVIISTAAILINVFLNYVLIFGKLGAPKMGVQGAAIATTIARFCEVIILLLAVYIGKMPANAPLKTMFKFDKAVLKVFFKTGAPVVMNEFMWGLGVTVYSLVYGRMGDSATAAITVTQSIEQVAQVVFMGLGSATSIILGNELGAGKLDDAKKHSRDFVTIQRLACVAVIALFAVAMNPIISMFKLVPEVEKLTRLCFIMFLAFLPFKTYNLVNIVGILRSGGDTRVCLFLDFSGVWLIGIPLAFLGGIVLKQPIYVVYAMIMLEEVYKAVFGSLRNKKGKWCRKLIGN